MHKHKYNIFIVTAFLSISYLIFACYLYFVKPIAYVHLIAEDSWAEYSTFVFYILASCFMTAALVKNKQIRKPGYVILAMAFAFIAVEEISWGQRLLGFSTFHKIAQYNFQAETNFHNIIRLPINEICAVVILLWLIALPLCVSKFIFMRKMVQKFGVPLMPIYLWPAFIVAVWIIALLPISSRSELGEALLSFAFVLFAMDMWNRNNGNKDVSGIYSLSIPFILIVFVLFSTNLLIRYTKTPMSKSWSFNRLASVHYPQRGMHEQAQIVFHHLLNNDHLMKEATLFTYNKIFKTRPINENTRQLLKRFISEQEKYVVVSPHMSKPNRMAGIAYSILRDRQGSQHHFQNAIEKDKEKLNNATENWEVVELSSSIGKTLVHLEQYEEAVHYFEKAQEATTNRQSKIMFDRWIEKARQHQDID